MRLWAGAVLKLVWGGYLLLTSLYCLLSYLPYTYYALIKAPPYDWMPWFAHHHGFLYWATLVLAAIAYWPGKMTKSYLAMFAGACALGAYILARPVLPGLQSDSFAYVWSIVVLAVIVAVAADGMLRCLRGREQKDQNPDSLLAYSLAIPVALIVALSSSAGAHLRNYLDTRIWSFHAREVELTLWSVISHVVVAVVIVTLLNFVRMVSRKTARPWAWRTALLALLVAGGLWLALVRFLAHALSFEGWAARGYAAALASALTLLGFSIVLPFQARPARQPGRRQVVIFAATVAALSIFAVALPSVVTGGDWNGLLQSTFALVFWLALSVCFYWMRPRTGRYSLGAVAAIIILTLFTYKGLQASAFLWAKSLGPTDDDVAHTLEKYAAQDSSFELAHHLLGNGQVQPCGDLCRILRQHSNIRNAQAKRDLRLVDTLVPAAGERPNIFIFVIDSLRPDYVGAYNPQVDFTPNLDQLARDSVVLRNAYTEYAGTTLSEPAIWSGARLLHAHYLQPFAKVNSLEKMARADGYQLVVSYDTVVSQLLSPSDDLVKLDTDKLWNGYETCSTVQQTESWLDSRHDKSRPVLLFAQPMNVHQFARNSMPGPSADHWRTRSGFNNRIAHEVFQVDECLGGFVKYLKARGLYDNSVIVVTSDHGDATGEFGRFSHSLIIYPEIMRVPLIVHLPSSMREKLVYDDRTLATLTDITPSLYYLLGHRPLLHNALFGRPLFVATRQELESYRRQELFLASDARAAYGILADNGRYLYVTYDSPAESFLFDLATDPNAQHNIATPLQKKQYDQRIIQELQTLADFYDYRPDGGLMLASDLEQGIPRGYIRIRTSDGFMHDIPARDLEAERKKDPGLVLVNY